MPNDPRPNILLITTDQQRYDTLGVHGCDWMKTPHLDALARRGVLFHRCEVPARMSATTLRPIIEGRETGREAVFCEHLTNDQARQGLCVRTERYKYLYWRPSGPEQFFDLQEDPLERTNLIGDEGYRDEISRHRLLLIERLM